MLPENPAQLLLQPCGVSRLISSGPLSWFCAWGSRIKPLNYRRDAITHFGIGDHQALNNPYRVHDSCMVPEKRSANLRHRFGGETLGQIHCDLPRARYFTGAAFALHFHDGNTELVCDGVLDFGNARGGHVGSFRPKYPVVGTSSTPSRTRRPISSIAASQLR